MLDLTANLGHQVWMVGFIHEYKFLKKENMDNIKIGDVVYLNSEERVRITVAQVGHDKTFQGVYYNEVKQEFLYTPMLHFDMVTKED